MVFNPLNARKPTNEEARFMVNEMVEAKEKEKMSLDPVNFKRPLNVTKKVYDTNRDIVIEARKFDSMDDIDFILKTEVDKIHINEFLGKVHMDETALSKEKPFLSGVLSAIPNVIETFGSSIEDLSDSAQAHSFDFQNGFKMLELLEPVRELFASENFKSFGISMQKVSDHIYDVMGLRTPEGLSNQIMYHLGNAVPYTAAQIGAVRMFKALGAAPFAAYMFAKTRYNSIDDINASGAELTQQEKDSIANQAAGASAVIEAISPFLLLGVVKGSSSFAPIKKGFLTEFFTEGSQNLAEDSILKYHNANPRAWNDIVSNTLYSAFIGGLTGSSIGGGAIVTNEMRKAFQITPKLKEAGLSDQDIQLYYEYSENMYSHEIFVDALTKTMLKEMGPENQHQRLQPEYQKLEEAFRSSKNLGFFQALAFMREVETQDSAVSAYAKDAAKAFNNMFAQDSVYLYSGIPVQRFFEEFKKVRQKSVEVAKKAKAQAKKGLESLNTFLESDKVVAAKEAAKQSTQKVKKVVQEVGTQVAEQVGTATTFLDFSKDEASETSSGKGVVFKPPIVKESDISAELLDSEIRKNMEDTVDENGVPTKRVSKELTQYAVEDIIHNSKPIKETDKEKYIQNGLKEGHMYLSPVNVIFAMMDGDPNYQGPNYTNFKRTIDFAYNKYLSLKNAERADFIELSKKLKLNLDNYQRIAIFAYAQQEGGARYLRNQGLSLDEIKVILSQREFEMYKYMRDRLDYLHTFLDNNGLEVPKKDNYFPFYPDIDSVVQYTIEQQLQEALKAKASTPWKRRGGKLPLELDAKNVFFRYFDQVYYAANMNPALSYVKEINKNNKFKRHAGDEHVNFINQWIDLLSKKGRATGDNVMEWMDAIRSNISVAILGFKLSTAIVQPSALFEGSVAIGNYAFRGFRAVLLNKDIREFLVANFPEIAARVSTEELFVEMTPGKRLKKVQDMSFWALRKMDSLTAGGVAFGAYMQYLHANNIPFDKDNPNKAAIEYAQLVTSRTQAATTIKDIPLAFQTGKWTGSSSINKWMLHFQTFALNKFSFYSFEGYQALKDSSQETKFLVAAGLLASTFYETAARGAAEVIVKGIQEEEDEEKINEFLFDYFKNLVSVIPLVPQAMSMFYHGSLPVPSISFPGKFISRGATKLRSDDIQGKAEGIAEFFKAGLGLAGVPGIAQADQII